MSDSNQKPPLRLEWIEAGSLAENPHNWRRHPEGQVSALRSVLDDPEVGWAGACLYNERTKRLIDGHARKSAVDPKTLVPVLVGDWSEAAEKKILATLDPLAAMATADADALAKLLDSVDLAVPDLKALADDLEESLRIAETEEQSKAEIVEDEAPAVAEGPTRCQPGDLWKLGEHRLLCGDSTKAEDVERLMAGESPFAMITDPPYGVKLDQSWRDKALGDKAMGPGNRNVVANDDKADWTETWSLFGGDVAYVWHADKFSDVVMESLRNAGFDICQQLIWNKSIMVMGRSDYHFKHEPCWYAVRKGRPHGWIGDRKQTTVIDAKSPNRIMSGSDEEKTDHPTQKPVECMAYLMRNHNGPVYDPFLGSGTTIIAAEQLGRKCYGMEISPQYCDVILNRWENLTGKTAERI